MEANARIWLGRLSRSPMVFALAAIAALALLGLNEVTYRRATRDAEALRMLWDARAAGQSVLTCVAEAESGEQGYLRTGRGKDLDESRACLKDIAAALQRLEGGEVRALAAAGDVTRLRQSIEQWRASGPAPGPAAGAHQPQATAIRALAMQVVARQADVAHNVHADLAEVLWLRRMGVVAMVLLGLLTLVLLLRQGMALTRQREQQRRRAVLDERDQLERQVRQRTEELTGLAHHLEGAAEDARARLAAVLHDEWGAMLTAAKLDAARLKARMGHADPEASARLLHLGEVLDEVITMQRRLIEELRPSSLQHLGLVPALEDLLADMRRRTGLTVLADLEGLALAPEVALTAYRVVQEALDNVQRHAGARQVWVWLRADAHDTAWLEVRDDGCGFDPAERRAAWHGLVGLRYRVQAVQGRWVLEAAPGHGTRVAAALPLLRAPGPRTDALAGGPCRAAPTGRLAPR